MVYACWWSICCMSVVLQWWWYSHISCRECNTVLCCAVAVMLTWPFVCNCDLMLLRDCYGAYMVLVDMLCVGSTAVMMMRWYLRFMVVVQWRASAFAMICEMSCLHSTVMSLLTYWCIYVIYHVPNVMLCGTVWCNVACCDVLVLLRLRLLGHACNTVFWC